MSDIHSTAFRYEAVCTELGIEPNPYVTLMFDKEKEEAVFEFKESMDLYLAGNNKLLTDKRLVDSDAEALYKTLCNNTYVDGLDLRYNNLTSVGAKHIAKLLEETVTLKYLNLMCNDIESEGAEAIAKALHKNESLRVLRLNGNKIGNRGGMCFAQMLQVNKILEALDLGDTDMTIEAVIALPTVLFRNSTLKALNVNRPLIFSCQEETTVHFAKMLKVNTSIEELHLQKYDMRDFGATRLAENLMANMTFNYLDLSCNRITRDGTKELAKVLKNNTSIKILDLGFNRLEDDGAMHLAEAIATYNTTLETLVVASNGIGNKGLCALADAMKTNTTLTSIFIWGNKLEEPACIAFASLLESGRLKPENTDIQAYVVDGVTKLCELSNQIRRHYYWAPNYGSDVPSWQPRGKNPRGSDVVIMKNLTVY
ncbi:leucine-rich repeat-containing protein 34-like isoform X2 [Mizuhopecten yessoensis]|uniref:Leucine-rich repeat-containing protein 34 n=1 Tax=Mizuhopecten yessoensis TaxID=6573 RepID=A0A210Q2W0_MIZYE|nr:leucine-rich repeat-containing protein 34-like isoform X2 [Mizuhopecten yessoensis]OWF43081.1 Leucine-rich repeat-containing protein 34 [Mizuhopecten yessoensis]